MNALGHTTRRGGVWRLPATTPHASGIAAGALGVDQNIVLQYFMGAASAASRSPTWWSAVLAPGGGKPSS
jgi:hypothetical protein